MNHFELVHSGDDYFSRLSELITTAKKEIHLQTYIFDDDYTGKEIAEALKKASLRQVSVYVLLDGYGSASLTNTFIDDLTKHGIQFRYFSPLFSFNNFYLGRRLHHKVVVADGNTALIGGINIADKYRGNKTTEPWLDYAVLIKGNIVKSVEILCKNIFYQKKKFRNIKLQHQFEVGNNEIIRILRNDWLTRKNEVSKAYLDALKNAKNEVIIVGSYFLPGKRFLRSLKKASLTNGVKVRLILSQVSDVPFVKGATRHLYFSLLKNNIEIYEWKNSVLHGKVACVDEEWATVGSFNLNHLSSYGSIELNAEIHSKAFGKILKADLEKVISQCDAITSKNMELKKGFFRRFSNWVSYRLLRLLLIIVVYLPYKRYFKSYLK